MVGIVFITSGGKHLRDPAARSRETGMGKGFTIFLDAAEFAGGLGVILGVLAQLVAIGLILIMLGAIQKKIFVWPLYIEFKASKVAGTRDLDENTLLDLDEKANIRGITVEHASGRADIPHFSYEQGAI
jgi:uncharacterized protein YuzE